MSLTAGVAPPRSLLGQALHAEWTKFRTVPGPAWLLAGVVALTVAVAAAAASVAQCQSATCGIDPATVSFTGIYPAQAVAAVAGVRAARPARRAEGGRSFRAWFTALTRFIPRRR